MGERHEQARVQAAPQGCGCLMSNQEMRQTWSACLPIRFADVKKYAIQRGTLASNRVSHKLQVVVSADTRQLLRVKHTFFLTALWVSSQGDACTHAGMHRAALVRAENTTVKRSAGGGLPNR